jgi:uncharacterized protein with HEPN domain
MPKDDRILLRHMLDAALKASNFIQGRSRGELDSDEMLALAVITHLKGECHCNLGQAATVPKGRKATVSFL